MIRQHLMLPVKVGLGVGLLVAITALVAVDGRDAPRAQADPAFGQVRVVPSGAPVLSTVVILGHYFSVPIQMTTCTDNQVVPSGTATSATTTTLTHNGQSWTANQWAGYDVQITSGVGSPQWRVVASNTNNTLTLTEAWGGVIDSGSASDGTVTTLKDTPTTNADVGVSSAGTTTTLVKTGAATWTVNAFAGMTLEMPGLGPSQTRIILSNTSNTLTVSTPWATHVTGTATSGTASTLVDTSKSWTVNQFANKTVQITAGTGSGQSRRIASNTNNTLTIDGTWTTTPNATSQYVVRDGPANNTSYQVRYRWLANELNGLTLEMPGLGGGQTRTILSNTPDTITVSPAWTTHVATNAATGGSPTTLTDTASWTPNAFVNKTVQITSGAASGQSRRIISNTANTLTIENTWTAADGGTATAATATSLTDASQAWTVNAFNGMTIEILDGAGAGQTRTISSNTATQVTVSSPWTTTPSFGDAYRILQVPNATSQFTVRDGPAIGTAFQIKQLVLPGSGSGYQLFKSHCRPAGHDVTLTYNEDFFELTIEGGISTSGNTSTTLNDTTKAWKINQWAGSRVNITGGAGLGQTRVVVSNTATQLVVSPAWALPQPTSGSVYNLGGIQDGGLITSTGRTLNCPGGGIYGPDTAEIHCVTSGAPGTGLPQSGTGVGNLATVIFKAVQTGVVPMDITAQVLEVDGTVIPADVIDNALTSRRIIICPDSGPGAGDGVINAIDLAITSQAFGHTPTSPPPPNNKYSPTKDINNDGTINAIDLAIIAAVFNRRCNQL